MGCFPSRNGKSTNIPYTLRFEKIPTKDPWSVKNNTISRSRSDSDHSIPEMCPYQMLNHEDSVQYNQSNPDAVTNSEEICPNQILTQEDPAQYNQPNPDLKTNSEESISERPKTGSPPNLESRETMKNGAGFVTPNKKSSQILETGSSPNLESKKTMKRDFRRSLPGFTTPPIKLPRTNSAPTYPISRGRMKRNNSAPSYPISRERMNSLRRSFNNSPQLVLNSPKLVRQRVSSVFNPKPREMDLVITNVYLGSLMDALDIRLLDEKGVTHIVDLANAAELEDEDDPDRTRLRVVVDDLEHSDISVHFGKINKFMFDAIASGGSVLVHCFEGKSRSATAVVQYLMTVVLF